jgi:hypothetical protein
MGGCLSFSLQILNSGWPIFPRFAERWGFRLSPVDSHAFDPSKLLSLSKGVSLPVPTAPRPFNLDLWHFVVYHVGKSNARDRLPAVNERGTQRCPCPSRNRFATHH